MLTYPKDKMDTSFSKYKHAAHIRPTTTAFIPSNALNTITNFFRLCHTGKKNSTSKALGKKIAIEPMTQPIICIFLPASFNAIPPV